MSNGIDPRDGEQLAFVGEADKPKPLKLDKAKRILKAHVASLGTVERCTGSLHEALWVIARSFSSRAQGGRASREKGKRGERELVAAFRALYPDAKRGLQSRGGAEVADVDGLPVWLESKRRAKVAGALSIHYRTAQESDGRPPVTVVREDGKQAVALVSLGLLIGLLDQCDCDDLAAVESKGREIVEAAK